LLEVGIDRNFDIHCQEYDELGYAKKSVIDYKPTEEGILEELL
jgi:hypothetical protein